jgi:hypothetical protein
MILFSGLLAAAILGAIGALHVYWAAGGKSGGVAIPERNGVPTFTPSKAGTLGVALLLFTAAALVLGRLGLWGVALPSWMFRVGVWGVLVVFVARAVGDFRLVGLFKRVRNSRFAHWDTILFTPLCLLIALLLLVVARS